MPKENHSFSELFSRNAAAGSSLGCFRRKRGILFGNGVKNPESRDGPRRFFSADPTRKLRALFESLWNCVYSFMRIVFELIAWRIKNPRGMGSSISRRYFRFPNGSIVSLYCLPFSRGYSRELSAPRTVSVDSARRSLGSFLEVH